MQINIKYRCDRSVRRGARKHAIRKPDLIRRAHLFRIVVALSFSIIPLGLLCLIEPGHPTRRETVLATVGFFSGYGALLYVHYFKQADIIVTVIVEGIQMSTPGYEENRAWEKIPLVEKGIDGYAIFRGPYFSFLPAFRFDWIPFSAFTSENDRRMFEDLVARKVRNYKVTS